MTEKTKSRVKVIQIGSPIGRHNTQRKTLIGLGLNKIGRMRQFYDTPSIRGMISKVNHLLHVAHCDDECK